MECAKNTALLVTCDGKCGICACESDEEGSGPEDETGEDLAKKRKCPSVQVEFLFYLIILRSTLFLHCVCMLCECAHGQHSCNLLRRNVASFEY